MKYSVHQFIIETFLHAKCIWIKSSLSHYHVFSRSFSLFYSVSLPHSRTLSMVDHNRVSLNGWSKLDFRLQPVPLDCQMEKMTKRPSVFSLSRPKSTKTKKEIMYELNKKVVSVKEGSRLWREGGFRENTLIVILFSGILAVVKGGGY